MAYYLIINHHWLSVTLSIVYFISNIHISPRNQPVSFFYLYTDMLAILSRAVPKPLYITNTLFVSSVAVQKRRMQIRSIPMRWGTGDNYAYVLTDDATKDSWVIDPAEADEYVCVLFLLFSTRLTLF